MFDVKLGKPMLKRWTFLWILEPPQGIFKGNPNWQGLQTIPWPAWNFPPGAECWVFPQEVEGQQWNVKGGNSWKIFKQIEVNWNHPRGREWNCNWHCLKINVFRWGKSVLAIIHPRKITCQWKYNRLKMYLLFNNDDFPTSHVTFPKR